MYIVTASERENGRMHFRTRLANHKILLLDT